MRITIDIDESSKDQPRVMAPETESFAQRRMWAMQDLARNLLMQDPNANPQDIGRKVRALFDELDSTMPAAFSWGTGPYDPTMKSGAGAGSTTVSPEPEG